MPTNAAYTQNVAKYKQNSVLTMSQGELIVALFEECIKQLSFARILIEELKENNSEGFDPKLFERKNEALKKSKRIVEYMRASLDMESKFEDVRKIANDLDSMYEFFSWKITQINAENNIKELEALIPMVVNIRDGFKGAAETVAKNGARTGA